MKQKIPRRAVVLAAGFGTRLLPLTRIRPKALLPLGGRPMLEHSLRLLASWGVDDVLVNCHWLADQVVDFLRGVRLPGMKISISHEPEILGTGGVLRRAEWFLGEEPFWMLNADVAAELDPAPLVHLFRAHRPLAVLWLHPERGPRTVELQGNRITTFTSRRPGSPGTCTFCGLQLLSPAITQYMPPDGFSSIITAYLNGIRAGQSVLGAAVRDSYWADIGSPEAFLEAQREIRDAHRRRRPGRFLYASESHEGRIHPDAGLVNTIVMDHAAVGPRAELHDAIVAPGCRINGRASNLLVPAAAVLTPSETEQAGGTEGVCAEMLPGRGSGRTFIRLHRDRDTLMLVRHTYERAENRRYIPHTALLHEAGVNVPEIFFHSSRKAFTLMEDLGTKSLQEVIASGRNAETALRGTLDQVIRFHEDACALARRRHHALEPPFNRGLYEWEHGLFCGKYLAEHLHLNAPAIRRIRGELGFAAEALLREPRVLLHRDLQSSNILFKRNAPYFIDYQGMRMGPAAYDLASLLCDPYVMLEEDLQMRLLARHRRRAAAGVEEDVFWLAAVQRLCQALGAYARLGALPQGRRFLDHISPASRMLARALRHVPHFPALRALVSR